jgi:hypothetical protein
MKINLPKIYSQNDERWKNKTLGTKGTIGAYGCLLTDIAMLCVYFGHDETPDTLNEKLKANGGYQDGNLYVWGALTKIYPDITYQGQVLTPDPLTKTQMDFIRSRIDEGYPVVLQIDAIPSTAQLDEHWVLAVDYDGDDFILADPWDGAVKRITSWGVEPKKIIYAYAWYKGTPAKETGDYYLGIDLNNKESIKVCVATWKRVIDGEFVDKSKYQELENAIANLNQQISDLNAKNTAINDENKNLRGQLKDCQDKIEEITTQNSNSNSDLLTLTQELNQLKLDYENAKKDWGIKEINYQKQIKTLQTKLDGYKSPVKKMLVDIWQKVVKGV